MKLNRRTFIKLTGSGAIGMTLAQLGIQMEPVTAYAASLKTEGAKEVLSVCPFCSVGCHIIAHVRNNQLISTEGDPEYPASEGALCAKGASLLSLTRNPHRVTKPLYRAPFSDKWEEKSWDWTLDRIARRVKETRDKGFIKTNAKGQSVNRVENIFALGTSHMDNEECALVHQAVRSLGIVYTDHQARI